MSPLLSGISSYIWVSQEMVSVTSSMDNWWLILLPASEDTLDRANWQINSKSGPHWSDLSTWELSLGPDLEISPLVYWLMIMFLFQVSTLLQTDQTWCFTTPGEVLVMMSAPGSSVTATVVKSGYREGTVEQLSATSNRSKITPSNSTTLTTDFHHQWFPVPSDESSRNIDSALHSQH